MADRRISVVGGRRTSVVGGRDDRRYFKKFPQVGGVNIGEPFLGKEKIMHLMLSKLPLSLTFVKPGEVAKYLPNYNKSKVWSFSHTCVRSVCETLRRSVRFLRLSF